MGNGMSSMGMGGYGGGTSEFMQSQYAMPMENNFGQPN